MKKGKIFSLIILSYSFCLQAQVYDDYIGAGHIEGVTILSSSNEGQMDVNNTISGSGFTIDEYQAARFLGFASLGADFETIQSVANQGISNWLDEQFAKGPEVNFKDKTWEIWEHFYPQYIAIYGQDFIVNHGDAVVPYWYYWKMAWWHNIMTLVPEWQIIMMCFIKMLLAIFEIYSTIFLYIQ